MTPDDRALDREPPRELLAEPDAAGEDLDESRFAGVDDLRRHTARGTILNSAYSVGIGALGLLQRLIAAAFLTVSEFGFWAVILTIVVNMAWLKELGIGDKYIQQDEPDQERAFQKAFTLELGASVAFVLIFAAALPVWGLAYGRGDLILPALLTSLVVPFQALQFPTFIPYRRLQYGRQRLLMGVTPVLTAVITVGLAIGGFGYWAFVWGAVLGAAGGAVVCVIACPYRLRLRFDRRTARDYVGFSWPLVAAGLSRLALVQGSLLIANWTVGLSGVGAIGIVVTFITFTDRIDTIISQTIYPAVCGITDRIQLMEEVFVKSNRAALMWAIPFAVGLALFAGDLITYVLGEQWRLAEDLLIATSLCAGFAHLGFNWLIFLRALNWTRPIFVASVVSLMVFLTVALPAMSAYGLGGYALAFGASTAAQLFLRALYMRRIFPGFAAMRHASRAIVPALLPAGLIILLRLAEAGPRTLSWVLVELAVYALATVASTVLFERKLIEELIGYLRHRSTAEVPAGA